MNHTTWLLYHVFYQVRACMYPSISSNALAFQNVAYVVANSSHAGGVKNLDFDHSTYSESWLIKILLFI